VHERLAWLTDPSSRSSTTRTSPRRGLVHAGCRDARRDTRMDVLDAIPARVPRAISGNGAPLSQMQSLTETTRESVLSAPLLPIYTRAGWGFSAVEESWRAAFLRAGFSTVDHHAATYAWQSRVRGRPMTPGSAPAAPSTPEAFHLSRSKGDHVRCGRR